MTSRLPILWLSIPLIALAACNKGSTPAAVAPDEVVATVNGEPISKSQFDLYLETINRQSGREIPVEQHPQVLDQYISMRLAADAAENAGITEQPEVQDQLELARMNVIVDAGLQKYLEDNPVTDEEIKPEYDSQVASMPTPREYRARHILVEDKVSADKITKELKAGADFAKLAGTRSKDSSRTNGGDLGWFTPDSMVKPFADAVVSLEPGAVTEEPVQSQFGWHVIKLEETRMPPPPAFDDVKDRVKLLVQGKKLQAYLDELRAAAEVEKKI